ncbi:MAG TPA: oligopeptidase B, partial [Salinimicrobium sp.]|nr:oligopeptidase B [Salinimicrobium sp.]
MKVKETVLSPPKAKKIPKKLREHNDVRIDNYYWLRERENPEVLDYLKKENAYNEQKTAHTREYREALFKEMKGRIKEDDKSVPYKYNGYWYITHYEKGKNYPVYSRKKGSLDAPEEILFDVNEMAKGHGFFSFGGLNVSPDNKLVAFATDTVGRRNY